MVDCGQRVVFDADDQGNNTSYFECKRTGRKSRIDQRNRVYEFPLELDDGRSGNERQVRNP